MGLGLPILTEWFRQIAIYDDSLLVVQSGITLMMLVSIFYFITDLHCILVMMASKRSFSWQDLLMILHHGASIGLAQISRTNLLQYRSAVMLIYSFEMSELSTIFLNLCWFWRSLKLMHRAEFTLLTVLLLATFFLSRIAVIPLNLWLLYSLVSQENVGRYIGTTVVGGILMLTSLNLHWFVILCRQMKQVGEEKK